MRNLKQIKCPELYLALFRAEQKRHRGDWIDWWSVAMIVVIISCWVALAHMALEGGAA